MGFLKDFFHTKEKRSESVVLIAISAESVAGAYVRYVKGETPVLLYTRRLPIEKHAGEPHETAMFRTLKILGDELVREGAPVLLRATGSGAAEAVLVSIDAPWQETSARTESFERTTAFTFTESMVATALEKTRVTVPEKRLIDESIISTILNGYETHNPYGRSVCRASVVALTSLIDETIADNIEAVLRGLFHTKNIRLIAGSSLRYQAIHAAFPHGQSASINAFQQAFEAAQDGKLWTSGNPPKIIPVLPSHLSGLIRQETATPPDLQLLLMALYCGQRPLEE